MQPQSGDSCKYSFNFIGCGADFFSFEISQHHCLSPYGHNASIGGSSFDLRVWNEVGLDCEIADRFNGSYAALCSVGGRGGAGGGAEHGSALLPPSVPVPSPSFLVRLVVDFEHFGAFSQTTPSTSAGMKKLLLFGNSSSMGWHCSLPAPPPQQKHHMHISAIDINKVTARPWVGTAAFLPPPHNRSTTCTSPP